MKGRKQFQLLQGTQVESPSSVSENLEEPKGHNKDDSTWADILILLRTQMRAHTRKINARVAMSDVIQLENKQLLLLS